MGWVKLTAKEAAVPPSAMDSRREAFLGSEADMVMMRMMMMIYIG